MSVKKKLKRALSAITHAQVVLNHAKNTVADYQDISRALRELDDAESDIKKSIRELD